MKSEFSSYIFVPQYHNMKYILTIFLCAIFAQEAIAGNREPSLVKGDLSATLAVAMYVPTRKDYVYRFLGPYTVSVDYQLSKRFNLSVLGFYFYSESYMGPKPRWEYASVVVVDTLNEIDYAWTRRRIGGYLTGNYCYVNRGRVSISCGLGLGAYRNIRQLEFPAGIDNSDKIRVEKPVYFTSRVRFADVKVRVSKKFTVLGGFGVGPDGHFCAGLNYKIDGHEE